MPDRNPRPTALRRRFRSGACAPAALHGRTLRDCNMRGAAGATPALEWSKL